MAGINDWYSKPWMQPPQYTDGGRGGDGEPDRERTPEQIDALIAGERDREPRNGESRPTGGTVDNMPMVYRNGDRDAVVDVDDNDELDIMDDYSPYKDQPRTPMPGGTPPPAPPSMPAPSTVGTQYAVHVEAPKSQPVNQPGVHYRNEPTPVVMPTTDTFIHHDPRPDPWVYHGDANDWKLMGIGPPKDDSGTNTMTISFGRNFTHEASYYAWAAFYNKLHDWLKTAQSIKF